MRLYGTVPSLLPRNVPESLNGDFTIRGYKIPAGTTVATQAYTVHRDPEIFTDPLEFKPERWLQGTDEMRVSLSIPSFK